MRLARKLARGFVRNARGVALLSLSLALGVGVLVLPTTATAKQIVESQGDFTVTVPDGQSAEYSFSGDTLSIEGGTLTVANTNPGTPTSNRIFISGNVDVTFAGVSISRDSGGSPVEIEDRSTTDVTIKLEGENSLIATGNEMAAIRKTRGQSGGSDTATLKITSASGDGSTEGSLVARASGSSSAAIGGAGNRGDVTDITIAGGTITASVNSGSAIGATGGGSTWRMVISGGIVKTEGGDGLGAVHDHGGRSEFQITGGYVVTTAYRGSTPTGGLVSTDGGNSFVARGTCELPASQSPLETQNLTIETGAELTIPEGATLTTKGTVINNGTVSGAGTLKSEGTFYNNGTIGEKVVKGDVTEQLVTVEGGTVNGFTEPQVVTAGTTVTIKADEVKGMVFSGWEVAMGHGVQLADPSSAETTFTMPEGSCVTVRPTYRYLFGTIVTEEGEEIPVTSGESYGMSSALREVNWQDYPNSTLVLTAPDDTAEGVSSNLSLYEWPEGATVDLNERTMRVFEFGMMPESGSRLTICNGTLSGDMGLRIMDTQLTLRDVVLGTEGSSSLAVMVDSGSLVFEGDACFADGVSSVSVRGYGGSVTMPCALAESVDLQVDDEVGINRIHSWTTGEDGAETCSSCDLARGVAEVTLSPAVDFVYDGEPLAAADMGVSAFCDGAVCSDKVVFYYVEERTDGMPTQSRTGLPRHAGTYRVTATLYGASTEDTAYDTVSQTVEVEIAPKPVRVRYEGMVTANNKIYDGTQNASISGVDSDTDFTIEGVVGNDQGWVWLRFDGVHGEFNDSSVGENKQVTVLLDNPSLTDGNYTLASNEVTLSTSVTASISQRPVTLSWQNTEGRYFGDGKVVAASVVDAIDGDDVVAQVANGDQSAVGTHTASAELVGADAENYSLTDADASVEYTIAPAVVTPEETQTIVTNEAGEPANTFTFGDTISVRVVPVLSSADADAGSETTDATARALTTPEPEQMALYYGETQISEPASAADDGSYTMTYDTSDGIVPAGTASEALLARLVGSENVGQFEVSVQVTIVKAQQSAPADVVPVDEATVGEGGSLTGLPAGGEWRPAGEGAWQPVPESGEVSGLPAGDYEVRLPGDDGHEPSDAVTVTVSDFSSTHGGITYPAGTTEGDGGKPVLPEAGGAVTFPNGATVALPGGTTIDSSAQTATTESGVVVTPSGDGLSVELPGGATVTAGSVTVAADGSVELPDGGEITYQDGTTGQVAAGETVKPDATAPEPEPTPDPDPTPDPTPDTEPDQGTDPEPEPGTDSDQESTPEEQEPVTPEQKPADGQEPTDGQTPVSDQEPAGDQGPAADEKGDQLAQTSDPTSLAPVAVAGGAGVAALAGALVARRRRR